MKATLPVLVALCLPLTGCMDEGPSEPVGSDPPDAGSGGTGPASNDTKLVEVLYYGFLINGAEGNGTIGLEVPPGSLSIYLSVVFLNGAYQNAAFTLGECQKISPFMGTAASAGGLFDAGLGVRDRAALHECGDVPDGPQAISWGIEAGSLQGRLMVYAEVPAE